MNDNFILFGLMLFALTFAVILYVWYRMEKETRVIHISHMHFMKGELAKRQKLLAEKKGDEK
jgi:hypothetical protein